jgi:sigma-B regulation protein RsbU (phosphoserine phosphatase)
VARANGSTKRLMSLDLPLGATFDDEWGRNRVTLEPGDQLVTFSDGVLDLFDGTLDSLDRVAELAHSLGSAQDLVDAVQRLASRNGAPDDVTIVAVRRNAR